MDIVIAVRQLNIDKVEKLHSEISNSSSANYRRCLSRAEVADITSNDEALNKIIDYISTIRYATVLKICKFGEYILVRAPADVWNNILSTKFDTLPSTERVLFREGMDAIKHKVPEEISELVRFVF